MSWMNITIIQKELIVIGWSFLYEIFSSNIFSNKFVLSVCTMVLGRTQAKMTIKRLKIIFLEGVQFLVCPIIMIP